MKTSFSITAIGHATSALLAISYTLCVVFGLFFPDYAMYTTWQVLLPGFEWISWNSFFLGLIETYAFGWYLALLWVPIYNLVTRQKKHKCCHHDGTHNAHAH